MNITPARVRRFERTLWPLAISLLLFVGASASSSHAQSERRGFFLSHEFYGPMGYTFPEAALNAQSRMTNMLAFWPPVDAGMSSFISSRQTGFNLYMQGASQVNGDSASTIASQSQAANAICAGAGKDKSLWSLMIEWDQGSGRSGPNGRPSY